MWAHLVFLLGRLRVRRQQCRHHRRRRLVLRGKVQRQLPALCAPQGVGEELRTVLIRGQEERECSAAGVRCFHSQPLAGDPSVASLPPLPMLGRPRRSVVAATHPVRGTQERVCDEPFKCVMLKHEATYSILRPCARYQQPDHLLGCLVGRGFV